MKSVRVRNGAGRGSDSRSWKCPRKTPQQVVVLMVVSSEFRHLALDVDGGSSMDTNKGAKWAVDRKVWPSQGHPHPYSLLSLSAQSISSQLSFLTPAPGGTPRTVVGIPNPT